MLISFVWNPPTSLQSLRCYLLPAATLSHPSPPPAPGRASFPAALSPLWRLLNAFFSLQPEGPLFKMQTSLLCLKLVEAFPVLYSNKEKKQQYLSTAHRSASWLSLFSLCTIPPCPLITPHPDLRPVCLGNFFSLCPCIPGTSGASCSPRFQLMSSALLQVLVSHSSPGGSFSFLSGLVSVLSVFTALQLYLYGSYPSLPSHIAVSIHMYLYLYLSICR